MYKVLGFILLLCVIGCEPSKKQKNEIEGFDAETVKAFSARTHIYINFYHMNFGRVPDNGEVLGNFLYANRYINKEDSLDRRFLNNLGVRVWNEEVCEVYWNKGEQQSIDTVGVLPICALNESVFSVTTNYVITKDSIDWLKSSLKDFIEGSTVKSREKYSHILIEIDRSKCQYEVICSSTEEIDHERLSISVKQHFEKYTKLEIPISILLAIKL